jgi:hypothetical protein
MSVKRFIASRLKLALGINASLLSIFDFPSGMKADLTLHWRSLKEIIAELYPRYFLKNHRWTLNWCYFLRKKSSLNASFGIIF